MQDKPLIPINTKQAEYMRQMATLEEDISKCTVGRPKGQKGRPRKDQMTQKQSKWASHIKTKCTICQLPPHILERVEADFIHWQSCREIADGLLVLGFKATATTVYNHCVMMRLDIKRANTLELACARIAEQGMQALSFGTLRLSGGDLIACLTLWAKLSGKLTDGNNVNISQVIRGNPAIEEIAREKDPEKLRQHVNRVMGELKSAGYADEQPESAR